MPRKVFTAGEVLAASDVNTFLMDQSVMSFAGTAARGSAIGTATEGMLTYLADSDSFEFWNGTAYTGLGGAATNAIINGAFEINQRGFTSSTTSAVIGFDRWLLIAVDGTATYSAESFTPGTAPVASLEGSNFARLVTTGQTLASAQTNLRQNIENVRTLAGQTVTVSFYAKAASGNPKISVEGQQVFGSGGSSTVNKDFGQATLTTSWQRFSLTQNLDGISGKTVGTNSYLGLNLFVSAGTDLNARTGSLGIQSNTFDIWGVQVEAGSAGTPFKRNANSLQGELAACQRYYFRQTGATASRFAIGSSNTTTSAELASQFPVTMRVAPTAIDTTGNVADYSIRESNSTFVASSIPVIAGSNQNTGNLNYSVASGLTVGRGAVGRFNTDNGFIGWSAEL
jgi:hypothetical protein